MGALGRFYIGPAPNGIEMVLFGECIAARALTKVLHILGLMRPKRIALTQVEEAGTDHDISRRVGVRRLCRGVGAGMPRRAVGAERQRAGTPLLALIGIA